MVYGDRQLACRQHPLKVGEVMHWKRFPKVPKNVITNTLRDGKLDVTQPTCNSAQATDSLVCSES